MFIFNLITFISNIRPVYLFFTFTILYSNLLFFHVFTTRYFSSSHVHHPHSLSPSLTHSHTHSLSPSLNHSISPSLTPSFSTLLPPSPSSIFIIYSTHCKLSVLYLFIYTPPTLSHFLPLYLSPFLSLSVCLHLSITLAVSHSLFYYFSANPLIQSISHTFSLFLFPIFLLLNPIPL